jgi:hypothetical protein
MTAPGVPAPARRGRHHGLFAAVMVGVVAVVVLASASQGEAAPTAVVNGCNQATPAAGCQGVVTGLPATASQVTVHGYGQYSNLAITVNQTKNLTNQAVSVTWTGGEPSFSNPANGEFDSTYNGNYLQIFQCWGDPQKSDPTGAGAGPLPTQCEYGGESDTPSSSYPIQNVGFEYSRVLSEPGWDGYSQLKDSPGIYLDKSTGFLVEPFQPVNGPLVKQQANYNYLLNPLKPQDFWLNPDFSFATTNEIDFARTYADGTGTQLFQMDTGLEAPGLGCGQNAEKVSGGTTTPQCWLVVVPRSTPTAENPANVNDVSSVVTSALTPEAWAHRIAIPLEFNPVGSSCSLSATAQEIIGGEMAAPAVAAWQPSLCDLPGKTPFSYIQNDDDQARQNLTNPGYGSVGMSVFSDPIAKGATKDPVVYAPLTLSGVVVAFNIERVPIVEPDGNLQPQENALGGDRLQHLYLTPLLVARLLTESYKDQLQGVRYDTSAKYSWIEDNPDSVFDDPQFLQYNPEFSQLSSQYQTDAGTLLVEEGSSDATLELWKWVLSDPQAVAWLDGSADTQMQVNPYYKIPAKDAPVPNDFPKSDPYCLTTDSTVYGPPPAPARPLCVLDWSPYELSMLAAAEGAANANDGAKTTFNPADTPDTAWTANGPQITGNYFIMSVTSSASADQYGLQAASLSPAGDDADPTFVDPDGASFLAGEKAMEPTSTPGVVLTNPSAGGGAYPLTMLTYAAATPKDLNATSRKNYSAFLRYAAGAGQVQGVQPGQLPAGYEPLPASLTSQTLAAATAIAKGVAVTPASSDTTTTTSTSSTTGDNSIPGSYGSGSGSQNSSLPASSGTGAGRHRKSHQSIGPSALSAIRSLFFPIGFMRWILPLLLLVGLCAAAGAYLANLSRKRALPEGFEDTDEMEDDEALAPEDDVP